MGCFPMKIHIQLCGSQSMTRCYTDTTRMLLRPSIHMSSKQKVYILQVTILHNCLGSSNTFLCWLENKLYRSVKLFSYLTQ